MTVCLAAILGHPPVIAFVRHAALCLCRDGTVLVEDFAFEEFQPSFVLWFREELDRIRHTGVELTADSFAGRLATESDPVSSWRSDHRHDLTSAKEIEAAVQKHFDSVAAFDAPYLYRYLHSALPHVRSSAKLIEDLKTGEIEFAAKSGLRLLGRRFVCRSPFG